MGPSTYIKSQADMVALCDLSTQESETGNFLSSKLASYSSSRMNYFRPLHVNIYKCTYSHTCVIATHTPYIHMPK